MSGAHPYLAMRLEGVISAWLRIQDCYTFLWIVSSRVTTESLNLCGLLRGPAQDNLRPNAKILEESFTSK